MSLLAVEHELYDFMVCKNDQSTMQYEPHASGSYGILRCAKCNETYLVVNNIVLTSEALMSDKDKQIMEQIRGS